MKLATVTISSAAALMLGMSFANAAMVMRGSGDNRMVVDTETQKEARLYAPGADGKRPSDCEAGAFYTMMDGDREVYASCDDEKMMFSGAKMDAKMDAAAGGTASAGATSTGSATDEMPLEPYAPGTKGSTN